MSVEMWDFLRLWNNALFRKSAHSTPLEIINPPITTSGKLYPAPRCLITAKPMFGIWCGLMGNAVYKRKHKELGLCRDCPTPAAIRGHCLKHYWRRLSRDREYQEEHREERNKYSKNWQRKNAAEGRCTHCGIPLIEGEGRKCVNCNSWHIIYPTITTFSILGTFTMGPS